MFSSKFLGIIREHETLHFERCFNKNSVILEIGGGTGHQARLFSEAGYKIESIDLQDSIYSDKRVYPVRNYDGETIPYGDNTFDIVFSSSVLEHILEFNEFQDEIRRILKPDGLCIHALPTGSWRFWTNITHYIELFQKTLLILPDLIPRNLSTSNPTPFLHNLIGLLKTYKTPPRHGETGNFISEIFIFSKKHWHKSFWESNFKVISSEPMNLFYTGHMLFGEKLSLEIRKILSLFIGSACILYKVKPSDYD